MLLFFIKLVHGNIYTCQAETFDDFSGGLQSFIHCLEVFISKVSEYIVNLSAYRDVISDTKA